MRIRYTPSVYSSCSDRLFGVVCNMWSKAIDHSAEVVVRASDEVPSLHVLFDGVVDH